MNPGYLSLLLISVALILLASGWKDILIRGISHKVILLFFVLWVGTLKIIIQWNGLNVHASFLLVALAAVIILIFTEGLLVKCHLMSIGLLLGSISFFLQEAASVVPAFMEKPEMHTGIFLGIAAFLLARKPTYQILCISVGLILGEIYYAYIHGPQGYHAALGGPKFQDKWWLALWMARGCTVIWQSACAGGKQAIKYWTERRKGGPHDRMDR
jgi:hypothetical protein